ncbi:MAG: hypothetical protein R3D89_09620 [Sphingomonadaceae bacterium]
MRTSGFVSGDATGIAIPVHPEAIADDPARFLTDALLAQGAIAPGNAVTQVTRFEPFAGGNSGKKLVLDVDYARATDAPTQLFAKFSRDFDDPFRDRRKFELEAEVRIAQLSRDPEFPVAVPRAVFADFHAASGTGLLITERIAFGTDAIEPNHPKCMDHLLPDPAAYYRVLVAAQARLAAAQHSGSLARKIEALFPFDRDAAAVEMPFPASEADVREKVRAWLAFIEDAPQIFPEQLCSDRFRDRFKQDAVALFEHEVKLRRFLHADPDFIALCHWNTNIDNAWFWHNDSGELQCGLLDWGMARQMNVGFGLWGGLSASDPAMLAAELDALLDHYAGELAARGGPRLDPALLGLHFDLSVALVGMALMLDAPALLRSRLPAIGNASGPHDPLLASDKVAQGFLHVSRNFLMLWELRDFGAGLRRAFDLS